MQRNVNSPPMIAVISSVCAIFGTRAAPIGARTGVVLAVGLTLAGVACGGGGATYVTVPMSQITATSDAGADDDASAGPKLPAPPPSLRKPPARGVDQ